MATYYSVTVETLKGERFSDTVGSDVRQYVKDLVTQLELGEKVGTKTKRINEYESRKWEYFHNGRITIVTKREQLTAKQRQ